MRVLMTGGGTGGHINPALAIANTIQREEPGSEIAFVGTPNGMENRLVPQAGYPIYPIEIQGLRRSLSPANLKTLYLMMTSVRKAKALIRDFRPDVCIGTGGYVSWPLIRAAASLGVPTALHESNALAGAAVRRLSPYVDIIFTNFEQTAEQLPRCRRIVHVGNPLKNGFATVTHEDARRQLGFEGRYRFSLLSCGGSLGAERINREMLDLMTDFSAKHPEIHHLHQSGVKHYPALRAEFERRGLDRCPNLSLVGYIDDMPLRLAAADVVVNRAGAMTISELALLKKAAILIPSPNVTDNHQYRNAKTLADADAAILIEEKELSAERLASAVSDLLENREKRRIMGENFGKFAIKNADILIYNEIKGLVISKKM